MRLTFSCKIKTLPAFLLAGLLTGSATPSRAADDYIVIVNKANPADSISANDLKKIFLGDKNAWANGVKTTAVTPSADSPEYSAAIKKATGMSSGDFKRYLIQMSFVGKVVPLPRAFDSQAAITHFVSATPGAVSCVPAGADVKTIKVE